MSDGQMGRLSIELRRDVMGKLQYSYDDAQQLFIIHNYRVQYRVTVLVIHSNQSRVQPHLSR